MDLYSVQICAGTPQDGYRSPLKPPAYGAGVYGQMTTAVYKLITHTLGFLQSLISLLLSM